MTPLVRNSWLSRVPAFIFLMLVPSVAHALPIFAVSTGISFFAVAGTAQSLLSNAKALTRLFLLLISMMAVGLYTSIPAIEDGRVAQKSTFNLSVNTNDHFWSSWPGLRPLDLANADFEPKDVTYLELSESYVPSYIDSKVFYFKDIRTISEYIASSDSKNVLIAARNSNVIAYTSKMINEHAPVLFEDKNVFVHRLYPLLNSMMMIPNADYDYILSNSYEDFLASGSILTSGKVLLLHKFELGLYGDIDFEGKKVVSINEPQSYLSSDDATPYMQYPKLTNALSGVEVLYANQSADYYVPKSDSMLTNVILKKRINNHYPKDTHFFTESYANVTYLDAHDRTEDIIFVCFSERCSSEIPKDRLLDLSELVTVELGTDGSRVNEESLINSAKYYLSQFEGRAVSYVVSDSIEYHLANMVISHTLDLDKVIYFNTKPDTLYSSYKFHQETNRKNNNDYLTDTVSGFLLPFMALNDSLNIDGLLASTLVILGLSVVCNLVRINSLPLKAAALALYVYVFVFRYEIFYIDSTELLESYLVVYPFLLAYFVFSVLLALCSRSFAELMVFSFYVFIFTRLDVNIDSIYIDSAMLCFFMSRQFNSTDKGEKSRYTRRFTNNKGFLFYGSPIGSVLIWVLAKCKTLIVRSNHAMESESQSSGEYDSFVIDKDTSFKALRAFLKHDKERLEKQVIGYWVQIHRRFEQTGVMNSFVPGYANHFMYSVGDPEAVTNGESSDLSMCLREPLMLNFEERVLFKSLRKIEKEIGKPVLVEFGLNGGNVSVLQVKPLQPQSFISSETARVILKSRKRPTPLESKTLSVFSQSLVSKLYGDHVFFDGSEIFAFPVQSEGKRSLSLVNQIIGDIVAEFDKTSPLNVNDFIDKSTDLLSSITWLKKSAKWSEQELTSIQTLAQITLDAMKSRDLLYVDEFEVLDMTKLPNREASKVEHITPSDLHHMIVVLIIACYKSLLERFGLLSEIDRWKTMEAHMLGLKTVPLSLNPKGTQSGTIEIVSGHFDYPQISLEEVLESNFEGDYSKRILTAKSVPLSMLHEMKRFAGIITTEGSPMSHLSMYSKHHNIPYRIEK